MNKKGFTLLESLFALIILTIAVSIFSNTQMRSLLRVLKEKDFLDRIFLVRGELLSFLDKQDQKRVNNFKKNIEHPDLKIDCKIIDIDKKSKLKSFMNDIQIVKTQGDWKGDGKNYSIFFVTFIKNKKEKS